MPEITLTGVNGVTYPQMATWHWEVAVYLFLGGLVAGLMIFAATLRLRKVKGFARAILISDIAALPLLGGGLLFLWLDLANRWNAWRFFTTLQVSSAMSWGSWILFFSMIVLALRLLLQAADWEESLPNRAGWNVVVSLGHKLERARAGIDVVTILLGIGLGIYTGVLLSTIPARPLWNSALLAPLFLVSGMATGGAFLCLFISDEEHRRLVPTSMTLCIVELALIAGYVFTLGGTAAGDRARDLLFGGSYGLTLWGGVVVLGLLIPFTIEAIERTREHLPALVSKSAPVLKLSGGVALRFVVVYAGLQSFI